MLYSFVAICLNKTFNLDQSFSHNCGFKNTLSMDGYKSDCSSQSTVQIDIEEDTATSITFSESSESVSAKWM